MAPTSRYGTHPQSGPVLAELGGHAVHRLTGLSATGVSDGLRALAEEGLAVRTPQGWTRGPADPAAVAEQLGVPELVAKIVERYRTASGPFPPNLSPTRLEPGPDTRGPIT
ncbi:hypothetical protein [Nonomuraea dietziae]|uniref:hypothetical protein n=1 Tax=Nonomuraea dietziae TaxID=65515 RepID=UPI0033F5FB6E